MKHVLQFLKKYTLAFSITYIVLVAMSLLSLKHPFMLYNSLISIFTIVSIYFTIVFAKKKSVRLYRIFSIIILVIICFNSVKLLSHFVADIITVKGESMENHLYPKDKILVLKYGFQDKHQNHTFKHSKSKLTEETMRERLSITKIRRNDILVFRGLDYQHILVKRCIALPGDTLLIKESKVYINGEQRIELPTVKFKYKLYFNNLKKLIKSLKDLEIKTNSTKDFQFVPEKNGDHIIASGTMPIKNILNKNEYIDSLVIDNQFKINEGMVFPENNNLSWTAGNIGPIVIPSKGMEIQLNDLTYAIYANTLRRFEEVEISKNKEEYIVDGKKCSSYKFTKNYYWFLGDNRHFSLDSRSYGFIPETQIAGKVIRVFPSGK